MGWRVKWIDAWSPQPDTFHAKHAFYIAMGTKEEGLLSRDLFKKVES